MLASRRPDVPHDHPADGRDRPAPRGRGIVRSVRDRDTGPRGGRAREARRRDRRGDRARPAGLQPRASRRSRPSSPEIGVTLYREDFALRTAGVRLVLLSRNRERRSSARPAVAIGLSGPDAVAAAWQLLSDRLAADRRGPVPTRLRGRGRESTSRPGRATTGASRRPATSTSSPRTPTAPASWTARSTCSGPQSSTPATRRRRPRTESGS